MHNKEGYTVSDISVGFGFGFGVGVGVGVALSIILRKASEKISVPGNWAQYQF